MGRTLLRAYGARAATLLAATTMLTLACNALVGVDDVVAKSTRDGGSSGGDPGSPGAAGTPGGPGTAGDPGGGPGGILDAGSGERLQLAVGNKHTCVLRADGRVQCWGSNASGELGKPAATLSSSASPVTVEGIGGASAICAGSSFNCAVKSADKSVWCWGDNDNGELGIGSTTGTATPGRAGGLVNVTSLSCGLNHACAISGGGVFCWGNGTYGRLGNSSETSSNVPIPVSSITGATRVGAGFFHTCAIVQGGSAMCWGSNDRGQLGSTTTTDRSLVPVAIGSLAGVEDLAVGNDGTCMRAGRVVACFGSNTYGQLANGRVDTGVNPTPSPVDGLSDPAGLGYGSSHVCAVRATGAATCWGRASEGQLGIGTVDASDGVTAPTTVLTLKGALQIGGGESHTCATTGAGEVYCWGANTSSQLGAEGATPRFVPQKVAGIQ